MQLLVKLSFSAAAVLLVSWAYRFYRSRDVRKIKPCGKENRETENSASHDYKRTQQHLCFQDKDDDAKQDLATNDLESNSTKGILNKSHLHQVEKSKNVFSSLNNDQNKYIGKEMLRQDQPTVCPSNISIGSTLKIHDYGMAAITGRRSPCRLKKLDGGVGVSRELRQDLEHQGVYSMTHHGASADNETIYLQKSTDKVHNMKEATDVETVGSGSFSGLPAEIFLSTDLEILKSKLNLGNCLEILHLAKKKGQKSVQQAALEVMSDNYLQVLRDPNLYGRLMADERERIRKQRMRARRFVIVADMDPQDCFRNTAAQRAKSEQRSTSSAVYFYDDYKDVWHSLCLIPQEVISKACAMCTMDNYLFVAVGCQGSDREMTPSKRVFCYNPLTSIWKEICPMNEARPRCKLAALDGYIYAIGGECLSSVERYDPRQDRWTFVAPLPNDTFAVAHHVTVCSGELFVSGGTLRYILLRYNPKTNTWRPSLIVGSKDRSIDMVAVGRFLYRFDINPLLGVSVFRYHTVARLWYECSTKRILHCPAFQCVAMDGTVYCLSRHFIMRFDADEISPAFADEELSVLSEAKGLLFPFILSLPDKNP
uniref:Kelch domain containing 7A n=1 Tax=Xiphophorus couchianus TaxID=32473 RepID=A0A3B5M5H3_9TELE